MIVVRIVRAAAASLIPSCAKAGSCVAVTRIATLVAPSSDIVICMNSHYRGPGWLSKCHVGSLVTHKFGIFEELVFVAVLPDSFAILQIPHPE